MSFIISDEVRPVLESIRSVVETLVLRLNTEGASLLLDFKFDL